MNESMREVTYAVGADGRYEMVPSLGWEPKNVANEQAWELIEKEIEGAARDVRSGKSSPLAYHMVKNMMNERLLANYVGYSAWKVKQHLKPRVFDRLGPDILERYGDVLEISIEELRKIPEDA